MTCAAKKPDSQVEAILSPNPPNLSPAQRVKLKIKTRRGEHEQAVIF